MRVSGPFNWRVARVHSGKFRCNQFEKIHDGDIFVHPASDSTSYSPLLHSGTNRCSYTGTRQLSQRIASLRHWSQPALSGGTSQGEWARAGTRGQPRPFTADG